MSIPCKTSHYNQCVSQMLDASSNSQTYQFTWKKLTMRHPSSSLTSLYHTQRPWKTLYYHSKTSPTSSYQSSMTPLKNMSYHQILSLLKSHYHQKIMKWYQQLYLTSLIQTSHNQRYYLQIKHQFVQIPSQKTQFSLNKKKKQHFTNTPNMVLMLSQCPLSLNKLLPSQKWSTKKSIMKEKQKRNFSLNLTSITYQTEKKLTQKQYS